MSRRPRKYITLSELLATALSQLLPQAQCDELRAAKVPAKRVIRLFTPDHNVLHALGGEDRWFNLTMRLRGPELKAKDARDTSIAAKINNRLAPAHEEFRRKILARPCGQKRKRTSTIPSRPLRSGQKFQKRRAKR